MIKCDVTNRQLYSADLVQGGLGILCLVEAKGVVSTSFP